LITRREKDKAAGGLRGAVSLERAQEGVRVLEGGYLGEWERDYLLYRRNQRTELSGRVKKGGGELKEENRRSATDARRKGTQFMTWKGGGEQGDPS